MMQLLKRLFNSVLVLLAALLIFIEEFFWLRLNNAFARLGRLPVLRRIEAWIASLPARWALTLFVVPVAAILPFKFFGVWLIAMGHVITGMQVFIVAKLVGTALAARLFVLCRPALMSKPWFARSYHWTMALRTRVYARVREMNFYLGARNSLRRVRRFLHAVKSRLAGDGGLTRRWKAIVRLVRMHRTR